MAGPYYVRSTDGSDASDGLSWANAKATLAGALAVAAAGERVWVSQVHAESSGSNISLSSAGTINAPVEILCGNDAAEPPTALATGAMITATGTNIIFLGGAGASHTIYQGIRFVYGNVAMNEKWLQATQCVFEFGAGANTDETEFVSNYVRLIDCDVVFSHADQQFFCASLGTFEMLGGSIALTGTVPTVAIYHDANGRIRLRGVDLSAFGAGKALVDVTPTGGIVSEYTLEQCKLGAGVALTSGANGGNCVVLLDNSDTADTQYRMQRHSYEGDVYSETTIIRVGGATNRTTALSHKMVSSAGRTFYRPLYGPDILVWNNAIGSPRTVQFEILHDSVTKLKDNEIWLEVEYLGTSGFPKSLFVRDRMTDILATPVDQEASVVDWVTTGLTNPNKQKLGVNFTPEEVGWVRCRVVLAKSSYTCFVDPRSTVS